MLKKFATNISQASHTMTSRARSSQGCWTCRLRRKKCDETRPICQGCSSLEITCHFEDAKPGWMDGGPRQKEAADQLKREVKIQANQRRERKYLQSFELAKSAPDDDEEASDSEHISVPSSINGSSQHGTNTSPATSHDTPPDLSAFQLDAVKSSIAEIAPAPEAMDQSEPSFQDSWKAPMPRTASTVMREEEGDLNFIMIYLDHVFPFLFPFYRPSLPEGGRGWVLSLLKSNKAVYHTALSLGSYYFSLVLDNSGSGHGACQLSNRRLLQAQQELSLQELQTEMAAINARGVSEYPRESVRVLNSIIQLLVFDIAVYNSTNWLMHVDAAISLFKQIIPLPHQWDERILQMGFAGTPSPPEGGFFMPWTTEQAALRTFGAYLFLTDVLTATSTERRPLLQDYHSSALDLGYARDEDKWNRTQIQFEQLFGCQTWVIHLVGEIASLDTWKKENKRAGSLSVTQLVNRAVIIEHALRSGIACLDGQCSRVASPGVGEFGDLPHPKHHKPSCRVYTDFSWSQKVDTLPLHTMVPIHTKVWAYAALTYLSVVVSGWQPSCPETASSIASAIELMTQLQSPVCVRTVMWPFCVVGCLTEPCHQQLLRDMVTSMGPLGALGSLRTALAVMEDVWARRDSLGQDWDIAACLQSLGHPVLMI
ncbi:Pestheic acid cluster transcriptional regulator 3 like protein [Verticillium longisporum]|nr:Putative guanosine-diphosphatase [Verticillium dahliae VDG2]KAG7140718.1 Pestheic acid cluster transcriptional regulator 3 like protein [Verticillium longisporum]PNH27128.1 hypothetical protein BJF96_g9550 [Verticillium dahliae]PNH39540.1 hypothetical protein VD0004_g7369 [Verticillium dahliae]PNH69162.1 hypothetical protein VD0001_g7276 [Verticillium dahliae]